MYNMTYNQAYEPKWVLMDIRASNDGTALNRCPACEETTTHKLDVNPPVPDGALKVL